MQYQRHGQPGCGGCLLISALFILLFGGVKPLLNFFGFLLVSGLFSILLIMAAFWGFTYYVQRKVSTYEASQTETHRRYVYLLVHILVKIAQSDGHFTRGELRTMLNFFEYSLHYTQDQLYWVKQLIKDARDSTISMDELLQEFRDTFAYEPRLILLELIYQVLYSNKTVPENDLRMARRIAAILQISAYDQRTIEARYTYGRRAKTTVSGVELEEKYYAVLGLEKGADFVAIKKAYRKLSMQYHPDKVGHLGEEFKKVAEEKMKEINVAYDYFEKRFNR